MVVAFFKRPASQKTPRQVFFSLETSKKKLENGGITTKTGD
jgi:hypothetical protein